LARLCLLAKQTLHNSGLTPGLKGIYISKLFGVSVRVSKTIFVSEITVYSIAIFLISEIAGFSLVSCLSQNGALVLYVQKVARHTFQKTIYPKKVQP